MAPQVTNVQVIEKNKVDGCGPDQALGNGRQYGHHNTGDP